MKSAGLHHEAPYLTPFDLGFRARRCESDNRGERE